jgi:hypothetical protein
VWLLGIGWSLLNNKGEIRAKEQILRQRGSGRFNAKRQWGKAEDFDGSVTMNCGHTQA